MDLNFDAEPTKCHRTPDRDRDIHGHAVTLQTMLDLIRPTAGDTIVTLGDYVNRGPETCQILEILSALRETCQHVAILGNHDEMMIDARCDA